MIQFVIKKGLSPVSDFLLSLSVHFFTRTFQTVGHMIGMVSGM